MQQGQVKPGDRVIIHGLKGRQDLNNKSAVLVGQAPNGRIKVKTETGEEVALKQENLGVAAPGGGGTPAGGAAGGIPGAGGMPGMPGGMDPQQMQAMAEQMVTQVKQALTSYGINLPASFSAGHLAAAIAMCIFAAFYIISRFLSMTVLGLVCITGYWGTQTDMGKQMLSGTNVRLNGLLGRQVLSPGALLCILCLAAAFGGHMLFGGSSAAAVPSASAAGGRFYQDAAITKALHDAYEQGHTDGYAGLEKNPPKHITPDPTAVPDTAAADTSSSGWGFNLATAALLKYPMVVMYIISIGNTETSWDMKTAIQKAKSEPMKVIMVLLLLMVF